MSQPQEENPLPVCTIFNEDQSTDDNSFPILDGKPSESKPQQQHPPLCNVFGQHSESQERDLFLNALSSTEHDMSSEDLSKTGKEEASETFDSLALSTSMDHIALQESSADFGAQIQDDNKFSEGGQEVSEEEGCLTMNIDSISDETVQDELPIGAEEIPQDDIKVEDGLKNDEIEHPGPSVKQDEEEKENIPVTGKDKTSFYQEPKEEIELEQGSETELIANVNDIPTLTGKDVTEGNTPVDISANNTLQTIETTETDNSIDFETDTVSKNLPESTRQLFPDEPSTTFEVFPSEYKSPTIPENDAFAHALCSSENDRRKDAWFPSEKTRAILSAIAINQKRIQLESNRITRPGLYTSESLENPSQKLVVQLTGSEDVVKLEQLSANSVSADKEGVQQLIKSGNLRATVNLCRNLLTEHGQGFGKASQPSINTPDSLQLWFTRISLLVKMNEIDIAKEELEQFGDLDNPDMYYEFYPDLYPGRKGSMVPFSFRVLYADFPSYIGSFKEAINRMHKLVFVCDQVLVNLNADKSEIGEIIKLKPEDKTASIEFWKKRKSSVLTMIGNTLVKMKDFVLAIETYEKVIEMYPQKGMSLHSGIGRILLQIGDIRGAQQRFAMAEKVASTTDKVQLLLNNGFMYAGANNWKEAYAQFSKVLQIDPSNAIAVNNKAVCLLYMGQLKNSVAVLETALTDDNKQAQNHNKLSAQYTDESLLSNLSTLYELESSRFIVKKRTMFLKHIAPSCTDSFNVACFKEI